MIPVGDDQGRIGLPWVTLCLLGGWVGVVAWCWQLQEQELLEFIRHMSLRPGACRRGFDSFGDATYTQSIFPLLSHGLVHVGPVHLMASMAGCWLFGSRLERRAGPLRYFLLLLGLQLSAGFGLVFCGAPAQTWYVGGSGIALGLGVVYLCFYPRAHAALWVPPWPLVCHLPVLLVWLILAGLQWPHVAKFFEFRSGEPLDWRGLLSAALAALVIGPLLVWKRCPRPE